MVQYMGADNPHPCRVEKNMTTIKLDDKALAALAGGDKLVAVADEAGNIIGFFAPFRMEYAEQYAEMAARAYAAHREGRRPLTTAEVVKQLESLEQAK
jgi:hypothetical protein